MTMLVLWLIDIISLLNDISTISFPTEGIQVGLVHTVQVGRRII